MNKNKHLTLDDRYDIQHALTERLSFKAIGSKLGKDCTTISKEVRSHISFVQTGASGRLYNDCLNRYHCSKNASVCNKCDRMYRSKCSLCGKCVFICPDYKKEICSRLAKPPYVCNGCKDRRNCTLEKRIYDAHKAQMEYLETLSDSRSGFNLTEEERDRLDSVISPLLKNGQSLHHILVNNPDTISCCEKTAYVYLNNSLFSARNIDAPRIVRFKPRNKSVPLKVDKSCRIGRTYEDFKKYHDENPSLPITELDSVEGIKGGAVLLTIHFVLPKLQLAFYRESNDSHSVTAIINDIYKRIGEDDFGKIFPLILADNGTEFSNPLAIEVDSDGVIRSQVFYCDPAAPGQKGACENNHEFIRRVIPKYTDIGKYNQEKVSLMMNHINSYKRPELGDKSPYEMFEFYYGKELLDKLGVIKIAPNDIILKPELLD